MKLTSKQKRALVTEALYKAYPDAKSLTRKQVVAAVKDLPVPFPFWVTHATNRLDDGTYGMPEAVVKADLPATEAPEPSPAPAVEPAPKKKAAKKKRKARKAAATPTPSDKPKKGEFKPGDKVKFTDDGEATEGEVVDNLSTQYFVMLNDEREVFVFKGDKRLTKV